MTAPQTPSRPDSRADAASAAMPRLLVVTGMSGAGKTQSLKALEDLGFEAVDNLPLSLLGTLIRQGEWSRPIAVGVDIRTRDFAAQDLLNAIESIDGATGTDSQLVFLDCDDETLARRFTETRHRHPLAVDRPLSDGLKLERSLLQPLRARADVVIDTSGLAPGRLKAILEAQLGINQRQGLMVFVTSFAYRHGLPREADLVFDVRFLNNPHYDDALKPLTGRDAAVAAFIERDPGFADFMAGLLGLLAPLLPRYAAEGKSYLTIALGCTGGRHRSVLVAEKVSAWLCGQGYTVDLRHRDLE